MFHFLIHNTPRNSQSVILLFYFIRHVLNYTCISTLLSTRRAELKKETKERNARMKERKIDRINSVTAAKAKQCVTMKYRQQWQRQNNNNNMQASKQPNNNNNKNNRQIVYLYMTNGCERYIAITHNIARRFRFFLVVESFSWCNCM